MTDRGFNPKKTAILILTRENARVEYLDYQIPVTQLKRPKGSEDMQTVKRD